MRSGETRPGAKVVGVTLNKEVIKAFDAKYGKVYRSKKIELLMIKDILEHRLAGRIDSTELDGVLSLVG